MKLHRYTNTHAIRRRMFCILAKFHPTIIEEQTRRSESLAYLIMWRTLLQQLVFHLLDIWNFASMEPQCS